VKETWSAIRSTLPASRWSKGDKSIALHITRLPRNAWTSVLTIPRALSR